MEHTLTGPRRPAGLEAHLRHHWSVAREGAEFAARVAERPSGTELGQEILGVACEVAADCAALVLCLASAGVGPAFGDRVTTLAAVDELTDLEALAAVLVGNRLGWQCIDRLALDDPWWSHYAAGHWLRRNAGQQDRVHELHPAAVAAAFALPEAHREGVSRPAGMRGRRAAVRGVRR